MSLVEVPTLPATAPSAVGGDVRRRPGATRRLISGEVSMIFRRRRNQAMLLVVAIAPLAIGIAIKVSSPHPGGGGPQFLDQVTNNGLFLVFTALSVTVPLLIPLLIGVVAGDSIAGEAGTGTLRYLLTVPVMRSRLLLAKTAGVIVYLSAAVLLVSAVGVLAGWALFGLHAPALLSGSTVSLPDGLLRVVESATYVIVTLIGFVAIGAFISTLTEVPVAAMAATVGIAIVASVLDSVPQLGSFREVLFTHNWLAFTNILSSDVTWSTLLSHLWIQVAYFAIFGSAAWARFVTADVTS